MQEAIVYIVILLAAIIVVRRIVRTLRGKQQCGCSGCNGCSCCSQAEKKH